MTYDAGIHMREAHFPGRAPIDAYGDGGFRFADMSHRGHLLCLPSGIYGWNPEDPTALKSEDFAALWRETNDVEILLIGTGMDLRPIAKPLREQLRAHQISADPMSTGAAVRTFNVLLAENRAVCAAFVAV